MRLSKTYRFEVWTDRNIEVGTHWEQAIQDALYECDYGLLFVSRDFLLSPFITEKELPPFVSGVKPVIPVGLVKLDFERVNLKGLEEKQIFCLQRTGDPPRFYTECKGLMSEEFVRQLATEIERKITFTRARQSASNSPRSISKLPRVHLRPELATDDVVGELARDILANTALTEQPVAPEAAPGNFSQMENDAAMLTQNRTLAVDYLADWASSEDGSPFCAVLGEVGIGKTTTLMLLAREMDSRRQTDPSIPAVIFIDLKDYYFEGDPGLKDILREVISRHWKGSGGRAVTPQMIIRAVQERGALIIFDGLDERIIPLPQQRRDGFIRQLWSVLPPQSQKPTPQKRPGRMIISCRSHYFPTVTALSSAFTGEGREGVRASDYQACVILPFNEKQIRTYLSLMLGPERVDDAIAIIQSVHNLTDLSTRPFLLSLIAPELAQLEQMKKEGRTVLGVTLYGLFVEKWLRRDEYKHQFTPEHKLVMMEELAAHLCRSQQKKIPWKKVSRWLDQFLDRHPEIRERYKNKPAEVLNQDFRAATFCLRPDSEKDGFRFAHTSLYEYFLALHLIRALEDSRWSDWDLPLPSNETLDFATQLLTEGEQVDASKAVASWTKLLEDTTASVHARRAAFKMWLIAHERNWPVPTPSRPQLQGLDLEEWKLGSSEGPLFDLRGASLVGTILDHSVLTRVLLSSADATNVSARCAEFEDVVLHGSNWEHADLCGSTWRNCDARKMKALTANWHDCDVIQCDLDEAALPPNWKSEAATQLGPSEFDLVLRQGHSRFVASVAWSSDGSRVASGSWDNSLKVWDAASGKCAITLEGHSQLVNSVAWSPDGLRIVSGSDDSTLKVWDTASGLCVLTLVGHSQEVTSVAWAIDRSRIVSGSKDHSLKVWDAVSGECIFTLDGHSQEVTSVALCSDGKRIVSGSNDNSLKVWDTESCKCVRTLEGHSSGVRSVAWSPDARRIISGSNHDSLKVWDAESGKCDLELEGHDLFVMSVAWSRDGTRVASGSWDNSIKVWDAVSGKCVRRFEGHSEAVTSVAWSSDSTRIVSGSWDNSLKVWDAASGKSVLTLEGQSDSVNCIAWSGDGSRIVTGSKAPMLKVWDAASGRCVLTLEGHSQAVSSVAWSGDGARIVSGSGDKTLKVWDAFSGNCIVTLEGHSKAVTIVAWSPDGKRIVSGSWDNSLKVWDAVSGKCVLLLEGHSHVVTSAAWSPDSSRIVSGSWDKSLNVWDAASGKSVLTLHGHTQWVTSVAWSPNGLHIVSGSIGKWLKVWDALTGQCVLTFNEHFQRINTVAWSGDGTRIVSGGMDKSLKVWDAVSGQCVLTLSGLSAAVTGVAWSPDSTRIVSGDEGATMREWDAVTGQLLRTWVTNGSEAALVDFEQNRVLHATPNAWRLLGWQGFDATANRRRLFPAEAKGPLPPW